MAIGTGHALVHDTGLGIQPLDLLKRQFQALSVFRQDLILQLTAHRHELFKHIPYTVTIEIAGSHLLHCLQFLLLTLPVQDFLMILDLVLGHGTTNLLSLFEQCYQLTIHLIDLLSQLYQIYALVLLHKGSPVVGIISSAR